MKGALTAVAVAAPAGVSDRMDDWCDMAAPKGFGDGLRAVGAKDWL